MRNWINLVENALEEKYLGTHAVNCDYGATEQVEVFGNPSRLELGKLIRQSEYGSVRASLYPEKDDLLIAWVGDRVQHHDMDATLFADETGQNYYIRLFIDATGITRNSLDDDDLDADEETIINNSAAIRRAVGPNFKIKY